MKKDFDVVVIGAGIAGAIFAWKLSELTKLKIAIVDAGDNEFDRDAFVKTYKETSVKSVSSPYTSVMSKLVPSPDMTPSGLTNYFIQSTPTTFKSSYQRITGGSTWSWRGNTPRYIPSDFELYDKYKVGRNWPLEVRYAGLEKWICDAEQAMGVSGDDTEYDDLFGGFRSKRFPMPKIVSSYSDKEVSKIINGMIFSKDDVLENDVALKVTTNPVTRNSVEYDGRKACEGNSSCIPICPSGAKYDASVHLKKAINNGVVLIKGAVVYQINKTKNELIESIKYFDYNKESKQLTASYFILAANAVESAKILLYSDISNSSKMVGKNLMDHLTEEVATILPFEVYPFRGPQSITTIESFRDGKFRTKMSAIRMTIGNDGWGRKENPATTLNNFVSKGLYGAELRQSLRNRITKQLRISYTTEVLPREYNMISLSSIAKDAFGIPKPVISFSLDDYNINAFKYAQKIITSIFNKLGGTEITTAKNVTDYNGSGHLIGTCIMGENSHDSVVDKDCRSFDHKNLFIIGASVLPSSATANPTITFAALTLRTAKIIADEFAAQI